MPEQDYLVIGTRRDGGTEILHARPTREEAELRAGVCRRTYTWFVSIEAMPRSDYRPADPSADDPADDPQPEPEPEEPMSETNGTMAHAAPATGRLERTQQLRDWMATLPPGTQFAEARDLAGKAGLTLAKSFYYRHRDAIPAASASACAPCSGSNSGTPSADAPAKSPKTKPAPATVTAAAPAKGVDPIDALRDFAEAVKRIGGIERALEVLALFNDMAG